MTMRRSTIILGLLLGLSAALHVGLIFWLPVVGSNGGQSLEQALPLTLHLKPAAASGQPVAAAPVDPVPEAASPANTAAVAPDPVTANKAALPLPLVVPSDDDYFRRTQLTVPAEPMDLIVIPDPGVDLGAGVKSVTLTIFINENGRVDRIKFDSGEVPAAMAEAARQAFARARFTPGQINGKHVKARMRVEVSFEATLPGSSTPLPKQ